MSIVAMTPFGGLLTLFFAMPLGIVAAIYGAEYMAALRHRPPRVRRP